MRAALLLAFVAAGIAVATAALTCMGDKAKCAEDECCLQMGLLGRCKKLQEEDKLCEVTPKNVILKDHVFKRFCPCKSGLKCVAKDGLPGKFVGTCQEDSSEDPDTDPDPVIDPEPEPEPQPDPEPEDPEPEEE